jgi:FkbM family methyltransferase
LRPGPIDVSSRLGRFRVHPGDNHVERAILLHPRYNLEEIDFLREKLPRDGVFIDIGANIGLYSVAVGRHVPDGSVIAIEPNARCCERLRFNLACNGMSWARVAAVGVADYRGRASLHNPLNNLAIVNTVRDDDAGAVEVRTLLDVLDETKPAAIHAMKIDIEGGEFAALAPFLPRHPNRCGRSGCASNTSATRAGSGRCCKKPATGCSRAHATTR